MAHKDAETTRSTGAMVSELNWKQEMNSGSHHSDSDSEMITGSPPQVTPHAGVEQYTLISGELKEEQVPEEITCGLGRWRPQWLQRFASKKSYVLVHGLVGLNIASLGSYFVATATTLEKRFQMASKTTGMLMSSWDIGVCASAILVGYIGSRGHKTRLVAIGAVIIGCACLMMLLPHIIYGAGSDALRLTEEYGGSSRINNVTVVEVEESQLCRDESAKQVEVCDEVSSSLSWPVVIFMITRFSLGVGDSGYLTLGMSYLDDNTRKDKAPIVLVLTQCIRMLGPLAGFSLASAMLALYVVPTLHPRINNEDPRWIGAWWMGWIPHAFVAFLLAVLALFFPRQLPRAFERAKGKVVTLPKKSFKDLRSALQRIVCSKVYTLNTLSTVFFFLGYTGYGVYLPKYMETQYHQTASAASLLSGPVGLVFMGLGLIVSATVITKFKPRPRLVAAWCVLVEVLEVIAHIWWAFLPCDPGEKHGRVGADGLWNLTATCNEACGCVKGHAYAPVCAPQAGVTYFSPCIAGCSTVNMLNDTKVYSDCMCVPGGEAVDGACATDCTTNFVLFIVTQCMMQFMGASGKVGNTILQLRCIDELDKSLSIGVSEFVLCVLAFIPGPVLYGYLIDHSCIVWGETCGQTGNCWLYDTYLLRYLLNFTSAVLLFFGLILDMGVWYYSDGVRIYDEEEQK